MSILLYVYFIPESFLPWCKNLQMDTLLLMALKLHTFLNHISLKKPHLTYFGMLQACNGDNFTEPNTIS